MARQPRYVGMPHPNYQNPAPGTYENLSRIRKGQRFSKLRRDVEIMKRNSGFEEFTLKGI